MKTSSKKMRSFGRNASRSLILAPVCGRGNNGTNAKASLDSQLLD